MTKTLPRRRRFLDITVYEAALQRVRHIYDIYDHVVVSFSGGKDSQSVLHLCQEVAIGERGHATVHVLFRDQELLPNSVIDLVDTYRQMDWVDLRWYLFPSETAMYRLGEKIPYREWDPARAWVRPKPPWGIDVDQLHPDLWERWGYDVETTFWFPEGRICILTGLRAVESLVRFRACVNKLHENYLTREKHRRVMIGKPIYDWQEDDVLKYLSEHGITWAADYDGQHWAGQQKLRVSTPLHSEAAKRLDRVARIDPPFFDRVMTVFPQMTVQARYHAEMVHVQDAVVRAYRGQGFDAVRRYVDEHLTDRAQKKQAHWFIDWFEKLHPSNPLAYPVDQCLRQVISGKTNQKPQALALRDQRGQRDRWKEKKQRDAAREQQRRTARLGARSAGPEPRGGTTPHDDGGAGAAAVHRAAAGGAP